MRLGEFIKNIFSITDYGETHKILRILGLKIKFPKPEYAKKKKESPYYYYKKNNIDITTLPPATGQIRDIQLANLALLKELDYVCKENGLTYWLDGGTLLGAVRHKGFIPWDDDVDTGMLRKDYENIIDAFNKTTRNSDLFAGYSRDRHNNFIIKIQHKRCPHLFVDIFPYDKYGQAMTEHEQLNQSVYIKNIRSALNKKIKSDIFDTDLRNIIIETINAKVIKDNSINDENCDFVWGIDFNQPYKNWFTNYNVIFPLKEMSFEGISFPVINSCDWFLKRLYGDYMAYPQKIGFGHTMYNKFDGEIENCIKELIKSE